MSSFREKTTKEKAIIIISIMIIIASLYFLGYAIGQALASSV
jgi:hypothetical protein